jgi:hypothetical protein
MEITQFRRYFENWPLTSFGRLNPHDLSTVENAKHRLSQVAPLVVQLARQAKRKRNSIEVDRNRTIEARIAATKASNDLETI